MKRRSLARVYGIIGAALMIAFAGGETLETYASSNAVAPEESTAESEVESIPENLPDESASTEIGSNGGSALEEQQGQIVQQGNIVDSPEAPTDAAGEEGTQLPEENGSQEPVQPKEDDGSQEPVQTKEDDGSQEPMQPKETDGESQNPSQGEGNEANPAGSASIVGDSYVELEEEIRYEGTVVDSVERSGGTFVAGTLCSAEPVTYTIQFTGQVGENAYVRYKAGALEDRASIADNAATVTLSVGAGDQLQMWYGDGETENLFLEAYLVIEQQAPEVSYKRITKEDGKQYARVTVTESGENLSGIKECSFLVDGEAYVPEETATSEMHAMPGGEEVPVRQEVDIPLEGHETHEIQADIVDNAGNSASETFSVKALPEGVVSVILPTSFRIAIRPYEVGENEQIYSDDVVICNKSGFPVDVEVSSADVEINHAAPWGEIVMKRVEVNEGEDSDALDLSEGAEVPLKDCRINFKLRQSGKEPLLLPLEEGTNEAVTRFSLEAGQEGTNPQELMGRRYMDTVGSSDYAIFNICGDLNEGSGDLWRSEDLVVRLVFKFHRQELAEEPGEPETQEGQ